MRREFTWMVLSLTLACPVLLTGCTDGDRSGNRIDAGSVVADPMASDPPVSDPKGAENYPPLPIPTVVGDPADDEPSMDEPVARRDGDRPSVTDPSQPDGIIPAVAADPLPGGVRVLVPENDFKVEGPDDALRITYDDLDLLKVINMYPVTPDVKDHMPDWLLDLEGKKVRLRGFMLPPFQTSNLPFFVLARDTGACCFGPNPRIYYLIEVIMKKGTRTDYIEGRPFDVVGTLRIDPAAAKDELYQLYQIEDAIVFDK